MGGASGNGVQLEGGLKQPLRDVKDPKAKKQYAVAELLDFYLFDISRRIYLDMSPDRRRLFHAGRRLLIVCEIESVCRRLWRNLCNIYPSSAGNVVEYENDPLVAKEKIIALAGEGKMVDAIVLDFFGPKTQSVQTMKELFWELKASGRREYMPAVVLNTASLSNPELSVLLKRFDEQRTEKELEEYYIRAKKADEKLPPNKMKLGRPFLFHDKSDHSLRGLVAEIDLALRVRRRGLGDADDFIDEFDPTVVEEYFNREAVYAIIEEARSCAAAVEGVVKELDLEFQFKKTRWWRENGRGEDLKRRLNYLGGFSFSSVWGKDYVKMGNRLNKVVYLMENLGAPDVGTLGFKELGKYADNNVFRELIECWQQSVDGPVFVASGLIEQFWEYNKPEVNVPSFVREVAGGFSKVEAPAGDVIVHGNQKFMKALISGFIKLSKKRIAENPNSSMKVGIRCVSGLGWMEVPKKEMEKLSEIGCKRCCVVSVEDDAPAQEPKEAAVLQTQLITMLGQDGGLARMREEKLGLWVMEKTKKGGWKSTIYLNMDAKK